MQLSNIRTNVRTRLGRPTTDNTFTDAVLNDIINEALQLISLEAEWPWLQTSTTFNTVANTAFYDNPADWNFTKLLFIQDYEPLNYVPLARLVQVTGIGQPTRYTQTENKIKLAATPDAVYTVNHIYYKVEPALVGDSDTPIMPAQFAYAIVARAVCIGFERTNQNDSYQVANGEWAGWLARLNAFRRRSSGPIPPLTFRTY